MYTVGEKGGMSANSREALGRVPELAVGQTSGAIYGYVRALIGKFKSKPICYLYDMCCTLLVLCSLFNGSRVKNVE